MGEEGIQEQCRPRGHLGWVQEGLPAPAGRGQKQEACVGCVLASMGGQTKEPPSGGFNHMRFCFHNPGSLRERRRPRLGPLSLCSHGQPSVHVCVLIICSYKNKRPSWGPATLDWMNDLLLPHHLSKDPVSKYHQIPRSWGQGFRT